MVDKIYRMDKFPVITPLVAPIPSWVSLNTVFLLFISSVLVAVSSIVGTQSKRPRILREVPIVGVNHETSFSEAQEKFRKGSKAIILEGYQKHRGNPFYVPTPIGNRMMIPPRYVEELKNEPNERADAPAAFIEMFEGTYTKIGTDQTLHPRLVKDQLNKFLPQILPAVDEEIQDALASLIPECEEWTEIDILTILMRVVARASSRMFGGEALSRDEVWTDTMIDFVQDSFFAAQRLKKWPSLLRPISQYFNPELKRVFKHFGHAEKLIVPIYKHRKATGEEGIDLLQWMMENSEGRTDETLSAINLHVALAAIHTSTVAVTHIVYDLCAYPEYVQELRDEVEEALAGEPPNRKSLLQMLKLDSFMRESQRINPLLLITYERVLQMDMTFKDGFTIPAKTQVGVPAHALGFDADHYPEPEKFDGYRFLKNRQANPQTAGQQSFTAANLSNMSWGYGRHACPGRWFADAEIKMILIYLMRQYDVKLPDGKPRPSNMVYETQNLPDRSARIMIRRRRD